MDIQNIAITGVSGRFPNTNNVDQLKEALLNGTDLITDDHNRWPHESLGTPPSMGIVNDLDHFDAAFFEVNPKSANLHDPRGRKLLEVVYESIVDAGFNPSDLKGSNTGVFVAIMQNSLDYDYLKIGSGINGTSYIIANNISYTFDFHGPSCGTDTGCSSSIYAINQAVDNMRLGACEAAVVCSAHANFFPHDSVEFTKLGVLNPEGRCKTFDDDRKGYVKSEALVAVFLQKQENAKRIYATIAGVGCNVDGYKEDGLIHPSSRMQISLLRNIYERYNINPNDVGYIDCHGTGTLVGDIEECQALAEFYANRERTNTLQIGSVKTNVGHTEAVGGLVSLVKILIAIQTEIIPANLHFKTPAIDIPALSNGQLKVVSSNIIYQGDLMAVNSFGLGGANGHLVIKPYTKIQNIERKNSSKAYRLVQVSGRTETVVEKLLNKIEENREQTGFLALIDNIFSTEIKNHNYRGYAVLNGTARCASKCSLKNRPVWFTYSGMGSQWSEMGKDLIHIDVFRNTLKKCAHTIKQYGLDLEDIVLNGTTATFTDPINCFTSIVAVSVALTDVLFSFGIHPAGIIGHSLGEIGCAYGDGLITAEQAILIAYGRGWATKNTQLSPGLMASVGLSIEECQKLLPEDIFVACDNSINNVTISGPDVSVKLFAEKLFNEGIFVRIVDTANIAFHSKYVKEVEPKLLNFLENLKIEPKVRKLWLPSALPDNEWGSELGKYNSSKYQAHNFMNKVLYNQVLRRVPKDAILIEIAPCGLFQAIFRRALNSSITTLYLTKKLHKNNHEFFLDFVGKYYLAGGQPNLRNLYNEPQFPVGPETPMISPLIDWNHCYKWSIPKYNPSKYFGEKVEYDMTSRENKYLFGHVVNEKNIFPGTGYIVLVWQTFSKMLGRNFENTPVVIERIKLLKYPSLSRANSIIFNVNILKSGSFEISHGEDTVATGKIFVPKHVENEFSYHSTYTKKKINPDIKLNSNDVYKILKLRGFDYEGIFRGIVEIDYNDKSASVKWNKNWIAFLDAMFQSITLMENTTFVPAEVSRIVINPVIIKQNIKERRKISLNYNHFQRSSFCAGLEIKNITWSKNPREKKYENVTKLKFQFIPNICTNFSQQCQFEDILQIAMQIVIENNLTLSTLKIAEILHANQTETCKYIVKNVIHSKYLDYNVINNVSLEANTKYDLIITRNLQYNEETLNYLDRIDEGTFIYTEITNNDTETAFRKFHFEIVFKRASSNTTLTLFKKILRGEKTYTVINFKNSMFSVMDNLKTAIANSNSSRILLVYQNCESDISSFYRCIVKEFLSKLRIFCIKDDDAEIFRLESTFYQHQIRKDIAVNILKTNEWGTYRHMLLEERIVRHVDSCSLLSINNKFQWVQQSIYGSEKHIVNVCYSSIGSWDQYVINRQPVEEVCLGMEYSGVYASGVKVMGLSPGGSLKTHLLPHEKLTWIVPRGWSLKDAATVPFAYTMSYYGLFVKGNLHIHDTILINYNANSIEHAAINFILNTHCTVFVGVYSSKNMKYLLGSFPKLKYSVIDFSKNNTTEKVMQRTHGHGIDIIFNSGKNDTLKSALDILKHGGKFINIGFGDKLCSDAVDGLLEKNCFIYNLTIENLLKENDYILVDIKNSIQEYLRIGVLKPFYSNTINMRQISSLLENINIPYQRVTVKIHKERRPLLGKNRKCFMARPRTYLHSEKCYVIISDIEIFDLEIIKWLSERGAKKFIISSTKRPTDGYQIFSLENLKKTGNTIIINYSDTTCMNGAEEMMDQALSVGNIGGIFCFSMELDDKLMNSLSNEDLVAIYLSKFKTIQNIDIVSRRMCKNLEHFVVFLSQHVNLDFDDCLNYACTNTSIENLCENRREENLPALAVKWGPITNIGSTSQLKKNSKNLSRSPQSIYSCLETLDIFMQLDHTVVSSTVFNLNEEHQNIRKTSITESVAKIFGIKNIDQIDVATPLINYGMDSIMGFEMKNLLCSQFNIEFSITEIRRLTMENIKKLEEDAS